MTFENPFYLYLIIIIPVIAFFLFLRYKLQFNYLQKLTLESAAYIRERFFYSALFLILTFSFLIIGSASPSIIVPHYENISAQHDIVFAFDVSRSMNTVDCVFDNDDNNKKIISRLDGARIITKELLDLYARSSFRYACTLGKGGANLVIPLTYNSEALISLLPALSPEIAGGEGTNLEKLLQSAQSAFTKDIIEHYSAQKTIVMFTDGEELSGNFFEAAQKLKESDISLVIVCLGSEEGGNVPIEDGFLKDASDKLIVSKINDMALKQIANETKNYFFYGAPSTPQYIWDTLVEQKGQGVKEAHKKIDITYIFAGLSLFSFILYKYIPTIKTKTKKTPSKKNDALLLCVFLFMSCESGEFFIAKLYLLEGNFLFSSALYEKSFDSYKNAAALAGKKDLPYVYNALSVSKLKTLDFQDALYWAENAQNALINTGNSPNTALLAFDMSYNLGIIYYNLEDTDSALTEFKKAVILNGNHVGAKRNLELCLTKLSNEQNKADKSSKTLRSINLGEEKRNSVLFDFVQQKEGDRWKSSLFQVTQESYLDY